MAFKAIVWDLDGTLVSSAEGITSAMREALGSFGFEKPELSEVRKTIGLTLEESIRRLTQGGCAERLIPDVVLKYRSLHVTNTAPLTQLFDGARYVLETLRNRSVASIVVSNKGRKGLDQLVMQLDLQDLIPIRLSAEDVSFKKPDPRLYQSDLRALLRDIHSEEVLVVGDTESDIRFAHGAGLAACWACYGYGDINICAELRPEYTINDITEVLDFAR